MEITASQCRANAQKIINKFSYIDIGKAEECITKIIKHNNDCGNRIAIIVDNFNNKEKCFYYARVINTNLYLSKKEWDVIVKDLNNSGFCIVEGSDNHIAGVSW